VFSARGFYPVTPGTDQYVFGSPLFKKASISFENGNRLVIEAPGNSGTNVYVTGIKLNGKALNRNYIRHTELNSGGRLVFGMGSEPDRKRGTEEKAFPFSMSTGDRK
jgi:putative alpha-1,2-mannosidase